MPQPINYALNVPSASQNFIGALQISQSMAQMKAQKQAEDAQRRFAEEFANLEGAPTSEQLAQIIARNPLMAEQASKAAEAMAEPERKARLSQAQQVYSALEANQPDMAKSMLEEQASAYRNSGMEKGAKSLEAIAKVVETNPDDARTYVGTYLGLMMGPKDFAETFVKQQKERRENELQPARVKEQQAKATKAAIDAKFAESNAVADLEKKGWDVTKLQNDIVIARENARIAAMNAKLNREKNEVAKNALQQKIDKTKEARDDTLKERAAKVEAIRNTTANSLQTIDRLIQNPALDISVGAIQGSSFYPSSLQAAYTPGVTMDDVADFHADLETLTSQQFIDNLVNAKEGGAAFGNLSESEGDRLVKYVRSFRTKQSEKSFKRNLKAVQGLLLKAQKNLENKYGIPNAIPETPEVEPTPEEIDAILNKYLGE